MSLMMFEPGLFIKAGGCDKPNSSPVKGRWRVATEGFLSPRHLRKRESIAFTIMFTQGCLCVMVILWIPAFAEMTVWGGMAAGYTTFLLRVAAGAIKATWLRQTKLLPCQGEVARSDGGVIRGTLMPWQKRRSIFL